MKSKKKTVGQTEGDTPRINPREKLFAAFEAMTPKERLNCALRQGLTLMKLGAPRKNNHETAKKETTAT